MELEFGASIQGFASKFLLLEGKLRRNPLPTRAGIKNFFPPSNPNFSSLKSKFFLPQIQIFPLTGRTTNPNFSLLKSKFSPSQEPKLCPNSNPNFSILTGKSQQQTQTFPSLKSKFSPSGITMNPSFFYPSDANFSILIRESKQ